MFMLNIYGYFVGSDFSNLSQSQYYSTYHQDEPYNIIIFFMIAKGFIDILDMCVYVTEMTWHYSCKTQKTKNVFSKKLKR